MADNDAHNAESTVFTDPDENSGIAPLDYDALMREAPTVSRGPHSIVKGGA